MPKPDIWAAVLVIRQVVSGRAFQHEGGIRPDRVGCHLGTAQTHPQDPDPAYSRTAARGVRLLFDGDGRQRVSALWVDTTEAVDIEVRCFNDFGGGAKALLYLLVNPGDAVLSTGRILGPRQLSKEPLWERWSAVRLKGE